MQFTGIVITYNEEKHLQKCLSRLSFCDQLVVIDLGSSDHSLGIAKQFNAEIFQHNWVPIPEEVRKKALGFAKNEWVIFPDPDEILPKGIEVALRLLINSEPNLGVIEIPMRYYFMSKPLHYTKMGQTFSVRRVLNKERATYIPYVHTPMQPLNSYIVKRLDANLATDCTEHYWIDSYNQLFEKHRRYIKGEGKSRYYSGEKFSWVLMSKKTIRELKINLIHHKGIQGGFVGIFLSFFFAWYTMMAYLSLRHYTNKISTHESKISL